MVSKTIQPTADIQTTSDIDALMRKVEARSRKSASWQFVAIFLILTALVIGVVGIYKQTSISKSIQVTQQNQALATIEARKANVTRQEQLANYIKCLALLHYDRPDLTPTSTRAQVATALDKCAVDSTK